MTKRSREEMRALLEAPFEEHQKTKNYKGFTVVAHEVYTRRLIEATDNEFDLEVSPPVIMKEGAVIVGSGNERYEAPVALAVVHVSIPGFGRRGGWGVQSIQYNQQEDAIKGAVSDGLKVACMRFGMGLDLYEGPGPSGGHSEALGHTDAGVPTGASHSQGQQNIANAARTNFISEKQVKFLAVLLKNNGFEPNDLFVHYRLPEDPETVAIPRQDGKRWIDAMVDKNQDGTPKKVTIPDDMVKKIQSAPEKAGDGGPAPEPQASKTGVTPDLPATWTEEKLGLGMPIKEQKEAWGARITTTEPTEANFLHLFEGAKLAWTKDPKAQVWRIIGVVKYAPTFDVCNVIANFVLDAKIDNDNLSNALMKRMDEVGPTT